VVFRLQVGLWYQVGGVGGCVLRGALQDGGFSRTGILETKEAGFLRYYSKNISIC
jgi:hypothetical protein